MCSGGICPQIHSGAGIPSTETSVRQLSGTDGIEQGFNLSICLRTLIFSHKRPESNQRYAGGSHLPGISGQGVHHTQAAGIHVESREGASLDRRGFHSLRN